MSTKELHIIHKDQIYPDFFLNMHDELFGVKATNQDYQLTDIFETVHGKAVYPYLQITRTNFKLKTTMEYKVYSGVRHCGINTNKNILQA